jgi:Heterokaryon incompatibility protein (HET)
VQELQSQIPFLEGYVHSTVDPQSLSTERNAGLICVMYSIGGCAVFNAVMPTRVLDVGRLPNQSIVLVETHGQRGRYMTLSHCWGTSHKFITTTANLGDRKRAISLFDLPQTYQDAVSITRQFGVQYLWIDSLCILQDSFLDWERESSRMVAVYGQSYLTISASGSMGDSSGCFPSATAR